MLTGVVGGGHVLLEDVPGTGKTLAARSLAGALDLSFTRIQFTPDLLPADITGSNVFDERSGEFTFAEGPVFANVVLADEINRAPPKTQAALLEAMGEGQVSVDGETYPLPDPFVVIATQNPVEQEDVRPPARGSWRARAAGAIWSRRWRFVTGVRPSSATSASWRAGVSESPGDRGDRSEVGAGSSRRRSRRSTATATRT
ncbi:AAA family ATPase [Halobaculum litoreum]|uniref:AAA family ATPase n=1 Tax=Halobaculum litoreum TaxID=3031998 RepID=UPI003D80F344